MKEEVRQFLKDRYNLLTTKIPNSKDEITSYHYQINGRLKELNFIIQYLENLKEGGK